MDRADRALRAGGRDRHDGEPGQRRLERHEVADQALDGGSHLAGDELVLGLG